MKTQLKRFAIFLFTALVANIAFGQFSRQSAENLVLNSILSGTDGKVDVSVSTTSVSGQIVLIDNDTVFCPYAGNWVFFVDDHPYSAWYHDCRYIFVNDQTGDYSIVNATIFPKNQSSAFESVAEASHPEPVTLTGEGGAMMDPLPPNDHYFAVIVCVEDNQANWNDVSLVYNTLIQEYGYQKENIFVHYNFSGTSPLYGNDLDDPNDPSVDIDYPATHPAINATFYELAGVYNNDPNIPELGHDDLLSVFFTDVPVDEENPENWAFWFDNQGEYVLAQVNSSVTANKLAGIDCAQMLLTFSINSGETIAEPFMDFTNPVDCESRYVHTATSEDEEKHFEQYITGGKYSEYLFYWAAAVRGFYPASPYTAPWSTGYAVGSFPFDEIAGFEDHPDDFPADINDDNSIQMVNEAFYYANNQNTWSWFGYHKEDLEHPLYWDLNPFMQETGNPPDVVSLAGYAGDFSISATIHLQGSFIIGGQLNCYKVWPGYLHFDEQSEIYLINPESGVGILGGLIAYVHSNCTYYSSYNTNKIEVNGNGILRNYGNESCSFVGLNNAEWGGFHVGETGTLELTGYINNTINISDCAIEGPANSLQISYANLDNCDIDLTFGDIAINYCNLTGSYINVSHPEGPERQAVFTGNQMNGQGLSVPGVSITNYSKFQCNNNTIQQYSQGISLNYSGSASEYKVITDNTIFSNTGAGIRIYWSIVKVLNNNNIYSNGYGIQILDRSTVEITGNDEAEQPEQTNFIHDCNSYELYSTQNSFPYPFNWNAIVDEDNQESMVYTILNPSGPEEVFKVENTFWGTNLEPKKDLYPSTSYDYTPIWELEWSESQYDDGEVLYNEAKAAIADSSYTVAESKYKEIISQYPSSKCMQAALKDLFALEEFIGSDYDSLKQFYNTETSIQSDSTLLKLANFLINNCEIKLGNWPSAIAWFEDIIQNPESFEDSIFAIIDLGYTYQLMENSVYKSAYTGQMTQYKFSSYEEFTTNREYLLSLLPGDRTERNIPQNLFSLSPGKLLQNIPNPFNGSTQILYKLEVEATVQLNVYNSFGQLVRSINEGNKQKGNHSFDFDANGLKNGIYFYSICINGQITDSKKMTIMK